MAGGAGGADDQENPDNNQNPPNSPIQTPQAHHYVSSMKLPTLKKGDNYDIWAMKMEHYITHTDYPLWQIILNGNSPKKISTDTNGIIRVLPPKSAEDFLAIKRERKAMTTLLMALPEDHLYGFHNISDAKEMWDAIKSRFCGNAESKKMQIYIMKQEFESFSVSNSEGLHKGYDRFQKLLSQQEVHGAGLDTLSFDDLYNNLGVFESDVKGSGGSSSSAHNVAFVGSECTTSTNEVSTAYGSSTSSGQHTHKESSSSYMDEVMHSFFANQLDPTEVSYEDLTQVDKHDLEEMDLKWQMAMLSMRVNKFYKKTRMRLKFNEKEPAGFDKTKEGGKKQAKTKALAIVDGESIDWNDHAEDDADDCAFTTQVKENFDDFALMAFTSDNEENPPLNLEDEGIVDSGCSRHMTGNKEHLDEYQDIKGGLVTFGGSKGRIIGKGKIRTGKLDFENVYFVKELGHFNLFSVSQICDKRNRVFFTESECLVLSPDFKMPDESQVLLKIPRKQNMYNYNLGNLAPKRDLACLVAKAIINESNKWHRMLGHGIKREYSNARTPQQNGVAERKNMTLIDAARTMLADSLLSNTFWAEAVNTACYVLNRVLVTKPQNKTPYELLTGKFDGKADEGFLVGYSLSSSMNYHPVRTENQANHTAGPQEVSNSNADLKSLELKNGGDKPKENTGSKTNKELVDDADKDFMDELAKLQLQEQEVRDVADLLESIFTRSTEELLVQEAVANTSSTTRVNPGSTPVNSASTSVPFTAAGPSFASYDDEGVVADFTILDSTVNVSPIPTKRIHSIHPQNQIIGDPKSSVQTRSKIEPKKISQALEEESWVDAMQEELLQFELQKVWILIDLPFGKKAIGTKWVYRNKKDNRGIVNGYRRGTIDKTLFLKKDKKDIILVQVYVDDIIFGSTRKSWCDEFEALMKSEFQMSSMHIMGSSWVIAT
ncbi:ribonuclease H-like domain-containing protein [Tanacetum coccineum]|uniref:Ribonuclease H-like domain-containing protein n=1 Tax=Tanacetum coccineum TaxID=301880 RepID=A0ABQ5DAM5_9ASTR